MRNHLILRKKKDIIFKSVISYNLCMRNYFIFISIMIPSFAKTQLCYLNAQQICTSFLIGNAYMYIFTR